MFDSVAKSAGRNAIGLLLTGMGDDSARGLLQMRNAGSPTFVQDESSSVVYDITKTALDMGAADKQGDPSQLASYAINAAASLSVTS